MIFNRSFPNPTESIGSEVVTIDCHKKPKWKRGERCWLATGPAQTIYEGFDYELNHVLKNHCSESPGKKALFHTVYMIGREESSAVPVLVSVCSSEPFAREAENIVKKHGLLDSYEGFTTALMNRLPTGKLVLLATDGDSSSKDENQSDIADAVYYDSKQSVRAIAMPILVGNPDGGLNGLRKATANLTRGWQYATVAHVFRQSASHDAEDEGWDSDDDCNITTEVEATLERYDSREAIKDNDDGSASLVGLGNLTDMNKYADWATINIVDSSIDDAVRRNIYLGKEPRVAMWSVPRQGNVEILTSRGVVNGSIESTIPLNARFYNLSHFQRLYQFQHNEYLQPGDCGSLVVDAAEKQIYGQLIAGSQNRNTAFMLPAFSMPKILDFAEFLTRMEHGMHDFPWGSM
ncbi:hypothetical protein E8E13_005161 [Curvularia kusanoi]|uniref:Uncharacterized protein n=1 Tax=Curvularia kusanoi TaxID=90978 RepID=A0A9P4W9N0_CURKU|nr:hypothetical protein E8E13_005161 [Curvularia kusanoi]